MVYHDESISWDGAPEDMAQKLMAAYSSNVEVCFSGVPAHNLIGAK